ncbi:putative glycosyltransferase EpsJ [Photobacterium piscicola]|uniref:Putative glycosyltransferase EpsJ n=1 Tax=Photobacterium piscicola TaxID=1378299 RepID=A0A1T5I1Y5_9GAMM|nr:glycosyltransferase family 2 protein [Photobacterium piscicola]SKC33073.1 putative glycosyltransferase EpsJ [Photobacterium piscicola]
MFISIITPLYNRAHYLNILAESIHNQNIKWLSKIEWIVVDDGSTDNASEVIEDIKSKINFKLKYLRKENGGKHTAVNLGIDYAKGKYLTIVDSDDHLVDNALDSLFSSLSDCDYEINAFIDGKSQYPYFDKEIYSLDEFIKLGGDRLIVIKTNVFRKNKFPIYKKERFVTESVIWNKVVDKYNIHCFNYPIITGEYIDGGLTNNYQELLKNNPKGVFSLLDTNLNLLKFKLNIVKQTAFHFAAIFSIKNTIKVFKKYPLNKSIPLILATIYVLIKRRLKS